MILLRKKVPQHSRKTVCQRPGQGLSLKAHLARGDINAARKAPETETDDEHETGGGPGEEIQSD
ncbi:hypothetical protein Pa4123_23870 [Phytohabitans aurantiacus]|uniref:Uncharacterized protein n=1 Tax=Phytohabitans aurantiacus TaxID=3016789 RepID=A0ABQ5QS90_9ACTN|nr:hypothetical protein Pa4123_23870 [Phytohabitans aurantiacus]